MRLAKPVNSNFGLPATIQSARPVAVPPVMSQTNPKVKMAIKIKIDLTQLVANNFVDNVQLTGDKASYVASVYIKIVDMWVSGNGSNAVLAIEDLNQKVLDLNFEL